MQRHLSLTPCANRVRSSSWESGWQRTWVGFLRRSSSLGKLAPRLVGFHVGPGNGEPWMPERSRASLPEVADHRFRARAEVAAAWGIDEADLPGEPGLQAAGIIEALLTPPVVDEEPAPGTEEDDALIIAETAVESAAAADDEPGDAADAAAEDPNFEAIIEEPEPRISGLVIGGVEINDTPDPEAFRLALKEADVVISLETRLAGVDAYADVVFPVSVDTERSGSYVNWEGRIRPFGKVLRDATTLTDGRVLAMIADELDRPIANRGFQCNPSREIDGLGFYRDSTSAASSNCTVAATPGSGQALLASWRHFARSGHLAGRRAIPCCDTASIGRATVGRHCRRNRGLRCRRRNCQF